MHENILEDDLLEVKNELAAAKMAVCDTTNNFQTNKQKNDKSI